MERISGYGEYTIIYVVYEKAQKLSREKTFKNETKWRRLVIKQKL